MINDVEYDLFSEREEGQENEDDLQDLTDEELSSAIVNATDWTIETILSQIDKGNIILDPKFQRRDAWRGPRKSEFIESLFLGLPVPQIVLASLKDKKGKYIVIDGKQRLLSIRQFAAHPKDETYQELKLSKLTVKKELNGKSLRMLRNKPEFLDDINAFENETIRTVVIKSWPNESFLYQVFLRLNTNSVGLSPQELRQALHPGQFIEFADEKSQHSSAIQKILGITKPDFRMRDVEIFIRFFAFHYFLTEYSGSMKSFLDMTCKKLNEEWDIRSEEFLALSSQLEAADETARRIFGDNAYHKWTDGRYESRFNRAVFDIMAYFFVKEEIVQAIYGREKELERAYKDLCISDATFLSSIERTTKSLDATYYRFFKWSETLAQTLGIELPKVYLENNRINFL